MQRFGWPAMIGFHELALDSLPPPGVLAPLPGAGPIRRREFAAGRACALEALRQAGYAGACALARRTDGLPDWPEGWTGSISHGRLRAIAVACSTRHGLGLGIDIEEWMPVDRAALVAAYVATPAELDLVAHLHAPCAVTLAFCAKEALYKALYPHTRRITEFSAARIVAVSRNRLRMVLSEDWSASWHVGSTFDVAIEATPAHAYAGLWLTAAESTTR
ncbi:MAG TPA: 4'-phosphopantetheinyl transferase [Xanthomonadaceae bacterium]|nr:4'-phosphopantetheinyl transferase [Xanthomonadaceae bacterium]